MSFKIKSLILIISLLSFKAFAGGEGGGILPDALVMNPLDLEQIKDLDTISVINNKEVHEVNFVVENGKELVYEDLNKKQYIIFKTVTPNTTPHDYKIVIEGNKTNIDISN